MASFVKREERQADKDCSGAERIRGGIILDGLAYALDQLRNFLQILRKLQLSQKRVFSVNANASSGFGMFFAGSANRRFISAMPADKVFLAASIALSLKSWPFLWAGSSV